MLGVELVKDRETREPDPAAAKYVMQRMKSLGVLTSTDGPFQSAAGLRTYG
jgi:4-aminobutyrate aminotransferase-like enzyme